MLNALICLLNISVFRYKNQIEQPICKTLIYVILSMIKIIKIIIW